MILWYIRLLQDLFNYITITNMGTRIIYIIFSYIIIMNIKKKINKYINNKYIFYKKIDIYVIVVVLLMKIKLWRYVKAYNPQIKSEVYLLIPLVIVQLMIFLLAL